MKIGINASFLRKQKTGLGQVTANFIKKLAEFSISNFQFSNNTEVEFILYLEEDVDLELPKNFKKEIFLPKYTRDDLIRKIWWERFLLPQKIAKDECDVFLSIYQCPTVLRSMLRSKKKTQHIMIVHDLVPKLFPLYLNNLRKKTYQWLTELAICRADKIIAVSHRTEKDLVQHLGIDPHKVTVSYIDVDPIYKSPVEPRHASSVLKKYNLKPGYIYSGGGLEVRKNTRETILAYRALLDDESVKDLPSLVISGKLMPQLAPLVTDVEKIVKELSLEKHVFLLDWVPQEDLPALYANASLFVFPSHYEGFGLPVLEAINQGTPVITGKTSSLPEVGSDSILYCDPDDVDDLAMVMRNVLTNRALHEKLSQKGKERATHFSWDKFVEKFIHIIEQKQNE